MCLFEKKNATRGGARKEMPSQSVASDDAINWRPSERTYSCARQNALFDDSQCVTMELRFRPKGHVSQTQHLAQPFNNTKTPSLPSRGELINFLIHCGCQTSVFVCLADVASVPPPHGGHSVLILNRFRWIRHGSLVVLRRIAECREWIHKLKIHIIRTIFLRPEIGGGNKCEN